MKLFILGALICLGFCFLGPVVGWKGCIGLFLLQWAHNLERHIPWNT